MTHQELAAMLTLPQCSRVEYKHESGWSFATHENGVESREWRTLFTVDQMRAYALVHIAAERERCIAVVMYELDSNGQAQAIEAEIRGVDWQNAKSKEAEDRLAKLRIQGNAAGNMWAALDDAQTNK